MTERQCISAGTTHTTIKNCYVMFIDSDLIEFIRIKIDKAADYINSGGTILSKELQNTVRGLHNTSAA